MNRNLLKLIVACGATCFIACTAPQKAETEKWSERMARSEMKRFPEPWMIEKAKTKTKTKKKSSGRSKEGADWLPAHSAPPPMTV